MQEESIVVLLAQREKVKPSFVQVSCGTCPTHLFLGWNWALRMGDGNRNLRSISPEAMSQSRTFQSVEELSSFRPLRFQLCIGNEAPISKTSISMVTCCIS